MSAFLRPSVDTAAAKVIIMDAEYLRQKTQKLREVIEDLKKTDHVVEKLRAEIEPLMKLA